PRRHGAGAFGVGVEARDRIPVATGPDDVRVARCREREAGFAAADTVVPRGAAAESAATAAGVRVVIRRRAASHRRVAPRRAVTGDAGRVDASGVGAAAAADAPAPTATAASTRRHVERP